MGRRSGRWARTSSSRWRARGLRSTTWCAPAPTSTDIDEFFRHVEVRQKYLGAALPTSTTVEVRKLAHPDFMVEIEAFAVIE